VPEVRLADPRVPLQQESADESLPARVVAKLRIEKAGRGGKTVSVV